MRVRSPQTAGEFASYFDLRWRVLRAPWGAPRGSERDELEAAADHAMFCSDDGTPLGVGRLHFNSTAEAQIRYMAVGESARGQGLGRRIVEHLEGLARQRGADRIVLNARDEAVEFYRKLGYETIQRAPTMFGSIAHYRMEKQL
jgi:ribosomal protein S18 acetylase RimI-like enzyme